MQIFMHVQCHRLPDKHACMSLCGCVCVRLHVCVHVCVFVHLLVFVRVCVCVCLVVNIKWQSRVFVVWHQLSVAHFVIFFSVVICRPIQRDTETEVGTGIQKETGRQADRGRDTYFVGVVVTSGRLLACSYFFLVQHKFQIITTIGETYGQVEIVFLSTFFGSCRLTLVPVDSIWFLSTSLDFWRCFQLLSTIFTNTVIFLRFFGYLIGCRRFSSALVQFLHFLSAFPCFVGLFRFLSSFFGPCRVFLIALLSLFI